MINKRTYYTGHLYRGASYETDDSCGNCDGARCDSCKKVTTYEVCHTIIDENNDLVTETIYSSNSEEDAKKFHENLYKIEFNGTIARDKFIKYAETKNIEIIKMISKSWYIMCIVYLTKENLEDILNNINTMYSVISINKILY